VLQDLPAEVGLSAGFSVEFSGFDQSLKGPEPLLQQVMRNLVQNAVTHHDCNEGTIKISAERIGGFAQIRVSDDGPGIPESSAERVFELFRTLAPRPEGEITGLGLATVRRIVERAGGEIRVMPPEDGARGATFEFTWPLSDFGGLSTMTLRAIEKWGKRNV
jgi:signal transduction histidine kinase